MFAALLAMVLFVLAPPHELATVPTGNGPCGAAAGFGAVWVAADGSGALVRIDPLRNRVSRTVRLTPGICSTAVGAGAVWVVNYRTGVLARIDPRSNRVRAVVVGRVPSDVRVAYGNV